MKELIQKLLDKGIEEGAFPSAAAAVGRMDEKPVFAWSGRCFLPDGPLVNADTRYDVASMTKVLASTAIALRAIEKGDLTLDDTVGRFFDAPADKKDITVRQLMTHTSGFPPHINLEIEAAAPENAIDAIFAHPLVGAPGDMPRYSCIGYILFGKLLEKLYSKSLDMLAREMVFEPLGMDSTGYLPKGGNIAATEISRRTGKLISGVVHDENTRFLGGVSGNAGVFSTAGDVAKFCRMLAMGGDGFLSPATIIAATRNRTPGFDTYRGLGFHLSGVPGNFMGDLFPMGSYGHTGFTGTSFAIAPQTGVYAVLLTNRVHPTRDNMKLMRFRRAFHNAVYAEMTRFGK